jgi:hypothetical protein
MNILQIDTEKNRKIPTCKPVELVNTRILTDYAQKSPRNLVEKWHLQSSGMAESLLLVVKRKSIVCGWFDRL